MSSDSDTEMNISKDVLHAFVTRRMDAWRCGNKLMVQSAIDVMSSVMDTFSKNPLSDKDIDCINEAICDYLRRIDEGELVNPWAGTVAYFIEEAYNRQLSTKTSAARNVTHGEAYGTHLRMFVLICDKGSVIEEYMTYLLSPGAL